MRAVATLRAPLPALRLKLGTVPELVERFAVGKRLDVLHGAAVHDVTHRKLDDLAALGSWYVGDLDDTRRHVTWSRVLADLPADPVRQRVVERKTFAQPHEQHDAYVALPVLTYREAFHDLVEALDLPVDLRSADANPARVQHRIGPAVDDEPVVVGEL